MRRHDKQYSTDLPTFFSTWRVFYFTLISKPGFDRSSPTVELEAAYLPFGYSKPKTYELDYIRARCWDELLPNLPLLADMVRIYSLVTIAVGADAVDMEPFKSTFNKLIEISIPPAFNLDAA